MSGPPAHEGLADVPQRDGVRGAGQQGQPLIVGAALVRPHVDVVLLRKGEAGGHTLPPPV